MISSRFSDGVSLVTTAHSSPEYAATSFDTLLQCSTDVQKMRQALRSFVLSTISRQAVATRRSSPIAFSTSSATNSPARMCRWSRSALAMPAFAVIFDSHPASIKSLTFAS